MLILIPVLWAAMALSFPIGKIALGFADSPLQLIGLRMSVAGGLILAFLAIKNLIQGRLPNLKLSLSDLATFAAVALFHVYLAFVPEFWALQFLDSLKVNLLFSLTPFISAFLAFLILNHTISGKKWLGLLVGLFGMFAILTTQNRMEVGWAKFFIVSFPELVLLVGIFSACYAWFFIRKLMHRGYSLLFINGSAFLAGGLACLAQHFLTNPSASLLPAAGKLPMLGLVGALVLVSNVIGYSLYGRLLHSYSNTFLSFTGFLCPIFGALYSKAFSVLLPSHFSPEPVSLLYLCGFALILTGLTIFYSQEISGQKAGFF